jgi:two-component system, OmpR family, phosphate regulon sensor histidine kinase PhoR
VTYLALLFGVLFAVDLYSARALRRESIRSASEQLASLLKFARARPPELDDPAQLRAWADSFAESGARVTIVDSTGRVLADSARAPESLPNESGAPEIREALETGEGQSVRYSAATNRESAYRSLRYHGGAGPPIIIRLSLPLEQMDSPLSELRTHLLGISLGIFLAGVAASLLFSKMLAARVERLKDFSRRVAEGDFRPLQPESARDEIAELGSALNETAKRLDQEIRVLSSERNRSSAILRSMVEGVAVIDAHERLVFCNRAFSEILNVDSRAAEGRPLIEVIRHTELLGLIRRALHGEEGLQSDIATGIVQQRTFAATAAPVKAMEPGAPEGRPAGAVVVLHEVTELRRLERVRQDFVANVSHEFKTPLTAIQGFAETLLGGALEDPKNNRRFLEIIRDHAARLAQLTDDLLKLARIEAGKLEVEFSPVSLMELIERCAETSLLKASRKQIAINVNVPPGLPPVLGDAGLLREVLQNLIDNAIQYTPEGGQIQVCASVAARQAVVTVSDTGIGIPLADQERIFERFYRVDAARSRQAGGTGLGLSIARHIVESHGGRIWVESAVAAGSKFSFSVPLSS